MPKSPSTGPTRFTSAKFKNYKALKNYSIALNRFNVLVGPNNAGKSTILGAFRILAEGLRKANARGPELLTLLGKSDWGYKISLQGLPVSTENVFTDYDESEPARITFRLSNKNELNLIFPELGLCVMTCQNTGKPVRSPSDFRRAFPASVGVVPVLGPVEHNELLNQRETARNALLSHRASRNFRNIWFHFPDQFEGFRQTLIATWPGMDIEKPVIDLIDNKQTLFMYCPEKRYPREIYWSGFGFQVWCQMLTHILSAKNDALLLIDEPDIYLHSDLQRQLVRLLQELGPDILIATHSAEIISEADPGDLLVVHKDATSARRVKDPVGLQKVFDALGSNMNPTLTQLAKTKRALFVEGKDFQILSGLAKRLGLNRVANRADFAVIPVDGYNPQRVSEFSKGMELTLGTGLAKGVVFDRDYKSDEHVKETLKELHTFTQLAHVHRRKELENYLLVCDPLRRAIESRLTDQNLRTGLHQVFDKDMQTL